MRDNFELLGTENEGKIKRVIDWSKPEKAMREATPEKRIALLIREEVIDKLNLKGYQFSTEIEEGKENVEVVNKMMDYVFEKGKDIWRKKLEKTKGNPVKIEEGIVEEIAGKLVTKKWVKRLRKDMELIEEEMEV